MTEIADKRDQRDPTLIGRLILGQPDKKTPAHIKADRVLVASKNGAKRDT